MKNKRNDRESAEIPPHYYPMGTTSITDRKDNWLTIASPFKRDNALLKNSDEPEKKKLRLDFRNEDVYRSVSRPSTSPSPSGDGDKNSVKKDFIKRTRILHYSDKDVLCGRGGGTNLHTGNLYYRELILSQCSAYENAT